MNQTKLFVGIALSISSLFASQTFAASACVSAACDPVAAAACEPAPAACEPACSPACEPEPAACEPACSPTCTPTSCDPAAVAACNSGCLSAYTIGAGCKSCGSIVCDGSCGPQGCAEIPLGKLKKSICEGTCWSGYINAGYDSNFSGDRSNGYVDCWNNTTPAFNALYIAAEKKAYTGGCGYDIGFGIDFMFGEDARIFRSARGFDDSWVTGHMYDPLISSLVGQYFIPSYGFSLPQLYVEAAINNWSVKLGHFYSLLGYEGARADQRFFYTKGLACQCTPVSQTGVLASYNGFENLDITIGWVNGWNNGFDNSEYGEGMVTGAFTYHMNKFASVKYAFMSGTADMASVCSFVGPYSLLLELFSTKVTGSMHNVVLDLQLTRNLESVFLMNYSDYSPFRSLIFGQHFYYKLNCCTKAGVRAEWKKTSLMGYGLGEFTTVGLGLNYHPAGNQNLYIRPELRYDRGIGLLGMMGLNGRPDQFTMGFDVMLTF